ncbi:class I adenylate-forming enzyme family protein [Streptomyces sp. NPDC055006]
MEIGHSLKRNTARHPDKTALVWQHEQISYSRLHERSVRVANAVRALGLPPRSNIGVLSRNRPEFLETCLGLGMAGMVPAPLNYRLTQRDWTGIAVRSELPLLFAEDDLVTSAPELLAGVSRTVTFGPDYEALLTRAGTADLPEEEFCSTLMLNTSGTTGLPKGVMRSRLGFYERSLEQGLSPEDVFLSALPLCLSAGITYTFNALFLGGTAVLMRDFDAESAVELIDEHGVTSTIMVPTMLQRLVAAQRATGRRPASLRSIVGGAGELTARLKRDCVDVFGPVLSIYAGSSEAGHYANLRPHEVLDRLDGNCVGRPSLGVDLKLMRDGAEVPRGDVGEICVRSDYQFDCYYKDPEATAALRRGPYLSVGDLGRLDEDGYLWFIGRERDVIKSGGINVHASEVEAALLEHPEIVEAAAVGLPHPEWTESVTAVVVATQGSSLTAPDLVSFTEGRLARFKRPRTVHFVDRLPRNLTGRVLKNEVRELAARLDAQQ